MAIDHHDDSPHWRRVLCGGDATVFAAMMGSLLGESKPARAGDRRRGLLLLARMGRGAGSSQPMRHMSHTGGNHMDRTSSLFALLAAACLVAASVMMPGIGHAQSDARVEKSMETLKAMTAKLGAPKIDGRQAIGAGGLAIGGKDAPGLYFGSTLVNNNFEIVDAIGKEDGKGMTATLFAKDGDEYIRVSTSVPKPDGSGRAIGTVLAGPALESIRAGTAYYGEVPILGTPYITGYEPIKDESGAIIGVYYVGYKK
jgi:Cache 3/Cache 2 fusion domain